MNNPHYNPSGNNPSHNNPSGTGSTIPAHETGILRLSTEERIRLWKQLADEAERYVADVERLAVTPPMDPEAIRDQLAAFRFEEGLPPAEVTEFVVSMLRKYQVQQAHPMYYGLFNPASSTMGVAGDFLAAVFNPQLAAWSHSPIAAEIENHLITMFGSLFGYDAAETEGTFTSGGAEANHTALLAAVTAHFPDYPENGVRSLSRQPVFYVSTQSHHSFLKAARFCGLGSVSVRHVAVDSNLRISAEALQEMISEDIRIGLAPFMVVASAGSTNAGVIDPLKQIADVAAANGLWFHVDAAWGGAAAFVPELKAYFEGMERSDSITFDAHKWMSVPMGAGIYLNRHRGILNKTCAIETAYMPKDAAGLDIRDPYMHSMQWSRRATGLKVFMSLAAAGRPGYESVIRHMAAMGSRLRKSLADAGFEICNDTPLPVVCFRPAGVKDMQKLQAIVRHIVTSGKAWVSTTHLEGHGPVMRACITNFRTDTVHTDQLVELITEAAADILKE